MATLTVFADTTDDALRCENTTYATARDGTGSTVFSTTYGTSQVYVGQTYWDTTGEGDFTYLVWQAFLSFDTSALGSGASLSAVALSLVPASSGVAENTSVPPPGAFTIQAREFDWGAAVTTADWRTGSQLSSLSLLATYASSSLTTSVHNTFSENSTNFQTAVVKTGTTRVILNSSRQVGSGTAPTIDEFAYFLSANTSGTTNDPKLIVTYTSAATFSTSGSVDGSGTLSGSAIRVAATSGSVDGSGTLTATATVPEIGVAVGGYSAPGRRRVSRSSRRRSYRMVRRFRLFVNGPAVRNQMRCVASARVSTDSMLRRRGAVCLSYRAGVARETRFELHVRGSARCDLFRQPAPDVVAARLVGLLDEYRFRRMVGAPSGSERG